MVLTSSYGASGVMAPAAESHATALAVRLGLHAHVADQLEHGGHVLQARHVAQSDWLGGQQRGAQLGQGRIFGAGNHDLAIELPATSNQ